MIGKVKERSEEEEEAGKKSQRLCDSKNFVSHRPLLRLHLAALSVRSWSIVGGREIWSRNSEGWRTVSGISSSACLGTTRPLRQQPKKTRKRRRGNGRGRQGLRKRPGKEDVRDVFFSFSLFSAEGRKSHSLLKTTRSRMYVSGVGK